jgi:hypothetical protein
VSRLCYRCPKRTPFSVAKLVDCLPPGRAEVNVTRSLPSRPDPLDYAAIADGIFSSVYGCPTRSMHSSSKFRPLSLCPLRPHSAISGSNLCRTSLLISASGVHEGDGAMEITIHKHLIEQCVTMACASKADRDKALWLTMAQSWVRLADEVARSEMAHDLVSPRRRH